MTEQQQPEITMVEGGTERGRGVGAGPPMAAHR
jgi:hypothetical protein